MKSNLDRKLPEQKPEQDQSISEADQAIRRAEQARLEALRLFYRNTKRIYDDMARNR